MTTASATLYVRPAVDGAIVRMPERDMRAMKPEGETVDDTFYWQRRLMLGDVVPAEPPPAPPPQA